MALIGRGSVGRDFKKVQNWLGTLESLGTVLQIRKCVNLDLFRGM